MDMTTLGAAIAVATKKSSTYATRAENAADRAEQTLEGRYVVTTDGNKIIIGEEEES